MFLDTLSQFGENLALTTGATGEVAIGDVIDTGGEGINFLKPFYLGIIIKTAVAGGGASTLGFNLISDDTAVPVVASAKKHIIVPPLPIASLPVGTMMFFPFPPGDYERYLAFSQTVGAANLTGGAIDAFFTDTPYTYKAFAEAIN